MNSVLHAGHWKSLKTSMTIGAFLEPAATCGSISVTAAVAWAALTPSAGASRSAKRPAQLKASELAFRRLSTQSSLPLYITLPSKNITCDSVQIEVLPQSMCAAGASALMRARMHIGRLGPLRTGAETRWKAAMLHGRRPTLEAIVVK